MSSTVLLNSSHWKDGAMEYKFNGNQDIKGKEIAIQQLSFYNSFFNVSSVQTPSLDISNELVFIFPVFTGSNVYTMVEFTLRMASGFYTYTDFNNQIQNFCILNGLYVKDPSTGLNVYFIDVSVNSPVYRIEIDVFYIPTAAQASTLGYTTGGMVLNTGNLAVTPQVKFTQTSPLSVFGFSAGVYPLTPLTSAAASYNDQPAAEILGQIPPSENQITALTLRCNLISDNMSYPTDLLCQAPISAQFGAIDNYQPTFACYMPIVDNNYSIFRITFADQNQNQVILLDREITIALNIRERARTEPHVAHVQERNFSYGLGRRYQSELPYEQQNP